MTIRANVFAKKASVEQDVISASQDISIFPIANLVHVPKSDQRRKFVKWPMVNVRANGITEEGNVTYVLQGSMDILIA